MDQSVPCRVVDRVHELIQLLLLVLREWSRLLVPAREVYIHTCRHDGVCDVKLGARVLVLWGLVRQAGGAECSSVGA